MTFDMFIQPLVSGILTGFTYALAALGITIIFRITNVLSFAHGEISIITLASCSTIQISSVFP